MSAPTANRGEPLPASANPCQFERSGGVDPLRILHYCSPQDWLVFLYLVTLNLVLLARVGQPGYSNSAIRMAALLGFFLLVVLPVRAGLWRDGFLAPLGYRIALQGTVQTSYFFFAAFLPLVNPASLDDELYALDLRLFGFEPSVELERFITPLTSEWFAFFYFCYFFVLALHTIPVLLFVQHERMLGEFTLGLLITFCVGHIGYLLVPGFGPVRALSTLFSTPFPGGLWVDTVMNTVKSGGAQKDIFPSLHTAAPALITLLSFRYRKRLPFRYSWPIVGFFAFNIIIATLFLRWHWLLDVVAGLVLATLSWRLSIIITDRDLERRRRLGLGPSWPRFHFDRRPPSPTGVLGRL
jgi:membrane-associated phospholipid phosphatase